MSARGRKGCPPNLTNPESGKIEHGEQEMLYKVFDFADKEFGDVMVPRPEVAAPPSGCLPRRF
jgi:CBS domain containing-hemolysin-like protein